MQSTVIESWGEADTLEGTGGGWKLERFVSLNKVCKDDSRRELHVQYCMM